MLTRDANIIKITTVLKARGTSVSFPQSFHPVKRLQKVSLFMLPPLLCSAGKLKDGKPRGGTCGRDPRSGFCFLGRCRGMTYNGTNPLCRENSGIWQTNSLHFHQPSGDSRLPRRCLAWDFGRALHRGRSFSQQRNELVRV